MDYEALPADDESEAEPHPSEGGCTSDGGHVRSVYDDGECAHCGLDYRA